ncbi:DNRLRE domain-containing protein, partial [Candidatus Paralachnospira sp. LCP21S3_H12]
MTIDPNTATKRESRMIIDTFIREKQPGETASGWGSAAVGYVPSYGRCRMLVKFKELPALDAGDVIYKGVFAAHQYKYDASAAQSFPVTVHEPLSDWDQTVTWNSQPSCSDTVLDFKT